MTADTTLTIRLLIVSILTAAVLATEPVPFLLIGLALLLATSPTAPPGDV